MGDGRVDLSTIIEDVKARKIYNSKGDATIEIDVITCEGFGRASAPEGGSRGKNEAVAYPSGGVDQAIEKVEEVIAPELIGMNSDEQETIDMLLHEVDGSPDFRNIGGNTASAVSLAVAKAAASSHGIPLFQHLSGVLANELPTPLGNVLGGGLHAGKNAPVFQEFHALPLKAASFEEAAVVNFRVHSEVGRLLEKVGITFTGGKGDEGAWAPNLKDDAAIEIVVKACNKISRESGIDVRVGLDVAASTFWDRDRERYVYARDGLERDRGEQIQYIIDLVKTYKLAYVEDPLHEEDFEGFSELTEKIRGCLICGDDLFTTNKKRLELGIKGKAANAIIIKPNQVGTLTDAYRTVKLAKKFGYIPVASHRSGETCDPYLAHVAVAFSCPIIKTGVVGGERLAKINELVRIERLLSDRAKIAEVKI